MKNLLLLLYFIPHISFSQNYKNQVDSILIHKFNNGSGVSALISQNFNTEYYKNIGTSNIELSTPIDKKSKFRIGSITKQFTAIAILKLQETGFLKTSDTIQKYLPDFPTKEYAITIEHLLTHTSGLKEVTDPDIFTPELMSQTISPEKLVDYFKDYPLEYKPRTKFSYNNSGYHLLGLIIQKASNLSYENYIRTNLLEVAQMENTLADEQRIIISNRVHGYEMSSIGIINATYIDMSIPFSGGNLLSTSEDLNRWYKALFDYKIVTKESLIKAHTPYILENGNKSNYGYGWFIDSLQNELVISHEGGINGFLSSAWFAPSTKTLVILLSNCSCNPTVNSAKKLMAYAIGKPLQEQRKIILSEFILQKYAGTYLMDGEKWTISIKDGNLYFSFENGNGHPIYAKNENDFFSEDWDSQFIFTETKNNNIEFQFIYLDEKIIGQKITVHN